VLSDLVDGQYVEPVGIVGFNIQEGWSRDVSVEVAKEIKRRSFAIGRKLPASLCKFIAERTSATEPDVSGDREQTLQKVADGTGRELQATSIQLSPPRRGLRRQPHELVLDRAG